MHQNSDSMRHVFRHVWHCGDVSRDHDLIATEMPVAMVYNGISHVVMMSTPSDLEDFAVGFSLSEEIISSRKQILDIEKVVTEKGIELNIKLISRAFSGLKEKRRNLVGRTGCGLCGAESLDQAIPQPRGVNSKLLFNHARIQSAIAGLADWQELQKQTGAVHAEALCDIDGNILLIREDVGRHNALDKLIGALASDDLLADGFVLVTSRASYEMVSKAANANISLLASVSAPTSLAIDLAAQCGLTLVGFSRPDRHVVYANKYRLLSDYE
jgi:FdhD protein